MNADLTKMDLPELDTVGKRIMENISLAQKYERAIGLPWKELVRVKESEK